MSMVNGQWISSGQWLQRNMFPMWVKFRRRYQKPNKNWMVGQIWRPRGEFILTYNNDAPL